MICQLAQPPSREPTPVNNDEAVLNSLFRLWADADTVDTDVMEN